MFYPDQLSTQMWKGIYRRSIWYKGTYIFMYMSKVSHLCNVVRAPRSDFIPFKYTYVGLTWSIYRDFHSCILENRTSTFVAGEILHYIIRLWHTSLFLQQNVRLYKQRHAYQEWPMFVTTCIITQTRILILLSKKIFFICDQTEFFIVIH